MIVEPAALYRILSGLAIGDVVPPEVYVLDYADGRRPAWRVAERTDLDGIGVRLLLTDEANCDMFDGVAVIVLSFPRKTLRTPPQPHGCLGAAAIAGRLCDMLQQQRFDAKRKARSVCR